MFAGHFAAGLAMRGRARQVPVAAYIGGAFLLDFLWIAFGVTGIDPTRGNDWSHSLLMALVWSTGFAAVFVRFGGRAAIAIWLTVLSHYVLDLLIQGATFYPSAPLNLHVAAPITKHSWLAERLLAAALILIFVADEWRARALSWRTGAACALIVGLSFR